MIGKDHKRWKNGENGSSFWGNLVCPERRAREKVHRTTVFSWAAYSLHKAVNLLDGLTETENVARSRSSQPSFRGDRRKLPREEPMIFWWTLLQI